MVNIQAPPVSNAQYGYYEIPLPMKEDFWLLEFHAGTFCCYCCCSGWISLERFFSITRRPYLFLLILSPLWLEVLLAIAANVELCHFIHLPLWLVTVTVDRAEFSESFQKKLEICLFIMVVPQFQPRKEQITSICLQGSKFCWRKSQKWRWVPLWVRDHQAQKGLHHD